MYESTRTETMHIAKVGRMVLTAAAMVPAIAHAGAPPMAEATSKCVKALKPACERVVEL